MTQTAPSDPELSVVVPAYNEEASLRNSVEALIASLDAFELTYEIVLVDDGSRDQTGSIADALASEHPCVSVTHQANQGLGGALRTGFGLVRGTYTLMWPADMTCRPGDLAPYLEPRGVADVIVGCRRSRKGYTFLMRLNAALYLRTVRWLFGLRLRDVNWTCLYRTSYLQRIEIRSQGHPMLSEILIRIHDAGGTFHEVDVDMQVREAGVASAGRPSVMLKALRELVALWWHRRRSLAR